VTDAEVVEESSKFSASAKVNRSPRICNR